MNFNRCEALKSQINILPTINEMSELKSKLEDQIEKNDVSYEKNEL
jgi:hypothetical protein